MPSMPVGFWNDEDGSKYRAAYFGHHWADGPAPHVWRHGDWVTLTERGSLIIHGRSDATLNRHGIRMGSADIYEVVETYSRQGRLGYVHFRNVRGKVPAYKETFIDEGDVDMLRVLEILKRNRFEGVLIPDHTPQMACAAPWHAGMAYALGYMRAAMKALGIP